MHNLRATKVKTSTTHLHQPAPSPPQKQIPKTPVCTKEGVIFDILNIMPYVRKHKKNPVTGESLAPKDLVRLNISKNADGKWHCPVTFKVRPVNPRPWSSSTFVVSRIYEVIGWLAVKRALMTQ